MPKIETRPTSSSRFESGFESTTIPALSVSWPRLGDFTGLLLRCVFPVAYGGGDPHPSYCLLRPHSPVRHPLSSEDVHLPLAPDFMPALPRLRAEKNGDEGCASRGSNHATTGSIFLTSRVRRILLYARQCCFSSTLLPRVHRADDSVPAGSTKHHSKDPCSARLTWHKKSQKICLRKHCSIFYNWEWRFSRPL